jgi:hypothetical protein
MLSITGSEPGPNAIELVSLCCSLNSPVVSIPELPVGPASAAIAIHKLADGGTQITVAVQCRRTADVVLYRSCGDSDDVDGVSERAALLWAEGMGFLFDDELCVEAPGENEKGVRNELATQVWSELVEASQPGSVESEPTQSNTAEQLSKFRFQREDWSSATAEFKGSEKLVTQVTSSVQPERLTAAGVA